MKTRVVTILITTLLVACTGIPVSSLPRLMKLQSQLIDARPAEFMLAIQVDARMTPPMNAVPMLQITINPSKPGAFDVIDKKLPMHFMVASVNAMGLTTATVNRRWLLYSLAPESQAELVRIQNYFREIKAKKAENGGGSISVGIAQDSVATKDPLFANTYWESWLQISREEGFFELWSGSVAQLLQRAQDAQKSPR